MNEMEDEKRKYNHKDRESQQTVRASWRELTEKEQTHEITKAVREFSQKAYRRVKSSYYEDGRPGMRFFVLAVFGRFRDGRVLAVFSFLGPSTSPETVKNRLRMKNRPTL